MYISEACFCFSDCNLPEVTVDFLKKSRELGKRIVLDPGSWKPHFPICLALADEVVASVNCRPPDGDILTFLQDTKVNNIAITDGQNDTYWYEKLNANQELIPVPKVDAVDSLAAGDAYMVLFASIVFMKDYRSVRQWRKPLSSRQKVSNFLGLVKGFIK